MRNVPFPLQLADSNILALNYKLRYNSYLEAHSRYRIVPTSEGSVPNSEPRPLHLHTLDSLIADLVSGRPVQTGATGRFVLPDNRTRSALEWYRKKGSANWTANVTLQHGEDLVDAILLEPPELPALPARPANANGRRLRLKKLEAHRFAGLHKFGTPTAAPDNYVHEFPSSLTLFEGRNGSGKTSLLNAII